MSEGRVLTEVHRMMYKKKGVSDTLAEDVVPANDTLEEDVGFIKKDFQLMESFLADAAEKRRQTAAAATTTSTSLWNESTQPQFTRQKNHAYAPHHHHQKSIEMGEWEIGLEATIAIATLVLTEVHRMRDKRKVPTDTLEEDMAFIKKDFQLMESFLVDAAEKRRQTAAAATTTSRSLSTWLRHLRGLSLSTWLRHLRGLSQDVEDCLQEFCLHLERPPRAKSKLLLPLDTITKQIRRLRNEIEHVNKSSAIYCNAINFGPDAAQPMVRKHIYSLFLFNGTGTIVDFDQLTKDGFSSSVMCIDRGGNRADSNG
uniref:Disease resistance N-terminal domain-containing protein n=1 Tax=Oryza rufipogon TaxID=4529 RepID=A0A0E0NEV5_ORYRU